MGGLKLLHTTVTKSYNQSYLKDNGLVHVPCAQTRAFDAAVQQQSGLFPKI